MYKQNANMQLPVLNYVHKNVSSFLFYLGFSGSFQDNLTYVLYTYSTYVAFARTSKC